jgi:hypothetical protein
LDRAGNSSQHDEEPWEMLYFKVYKSQLEVIEQAMETASLMLGGQKSRGYCLEMMICADFLAGANLEDPNPSTLSNLIRTFFELLRRQVRSKCSSRPCGNVREFNPAAAPEIETRARFLPSASPESSRARWLEMPAVRTRDGARGSPHSLSQCPRKR